MAQPYRIAIAGLGTVGAGLLKLLEQNKGVIAQRCGRTIEVVAVNARDRSKDRGIDLSPYHWCDTAEQVVDEATPDCVVELIGGAEGPAKDLVEKALEQKKSVVTANKALLAHHGGMLAQKAEANEVALKYEAAVAGGIPIIKALAEGYAANQVKTVAGILNGTSNYILTAMQQSGKDFATILKEAQDKGYAEADPSFDVNGTDAAHKICILSALAFGLKPKFEGFSVQGITTITLTDIHHAAKLGYKIKLLGVARYDKDNNSLQQAVEPCLIPQDHALAGVDDVFNAVMIEGNFVGQGLLTGRGAGAGPTASAVMADIMDLARGWESPAFGVPVSDLKDITWQDPADVTSPYYMRLTLQDGDGTPARVRELAEDYHIGFESVVVEPIGPNQKSIIGKTRPVTGRDIQRFSASLTERAYTQTAPFLLRIEHF